MLNNLHLISAILIIMVLYAFTVNMEFFSQQDADKFYEPDLCGREFCNLNNWPLPFDIKTSDKYIGYYMVGSCMNGCRARKLKFDINKTIL